MYKKHFIWAVLFFLLFEVKAQNIDSLKLVVKTQRGKERVKTLNDLCWYLGGIDRQAATDYALESIKLSKALKNDTLLAQIYNDYGTLFLRNGDYDSTQKYYSKSIALRKKLKDDDGVASINSKLAVMYEVKGDYEKALKYDLEVLRIYERHGQEKNIGILKSNIAVIYYNLKQFKLALKFNKETEDLAIKLNDDYLWRSVYTNYGSIYGLTGQPDSAVIYLKKAIPFIEKNADNNALSAVYNNLGNILLQLGKMDEAMPYLEESLRLRLELNDKKGLAFSYNVLAGAYLEKNNIKKALQYCDLAYKISKEIQVKEGIKNALTTYTNIYSIKGDWKKVSESQAEFIVIKDSIFSESMNKQFAEMETKYETEKKDIEINLLNKDNDLKEVSIEKQKIQKYAVGFGLFLVLIFALFIFNRLQITRKQKLIIENQRGELVEANEDLNQTNEEILAQRDQIEYQKQIVEHAHQEVKASINYAERIQKALLSSEDDWQNISQNHFILFKPRDVVSGDFYWAYAKENQVFWAAADCTGHGVPGAFMSMLGVGFLNEIVAEGGETNAGKILDKLRYKIIHSLKQKGDEQRKDGMDIALCFWDKSTNILQYSGAYNPLILVRENTKPEPSGFDKKMEDNGICLYDFKADKMPIGKFILDKKAFETIEIQLEKGDSLYTFTDGFQDQFGGEEGKKYMIKKLKSKLLSLHKLQMEVQKSTLNNEFENWIKIGKSEQIDDVCIVGVKIE